MAKSMTFGEFKNAVDSSAFPVHHANIRSAVKKILMGYDDSVEFRFDPEGVQFLVKTFEDRQRTALRPLTARSINNYRQSFFHAAYVVAETPMKVRTKLVFELPDGVS